MEVLANRLKWLREKERLGQKEVASEIGVTLSGYQQFEYGKSKPKLETLVKICDLYNVSADFLLGRSNEIEPLRLLENEISVQKARLTISKQQLYEVLGRINNLEVEIEEIRVTAHTFLEVKTDRLSQKESTLQNYTHEKYRLETEIMSLSNEYGDSVLNYMHLLIEIPNANPRKDKVLKQFLPFRFEIQPDIFDDYSISIYGENIGHIGHYGQYDTFEIAEEEIQKLKLLYNGR